MAAARTLLSSDVEIIEYIPDIIIRFPESRIIDQGAVTLLSAAYNNSEMRDTVKQIVASLQNSPSADYIADEMSWRMEF